MATGQAPSANAVKAGEAFVELSANDSKFTRVLDGMKDKLANVGSALRIGGAGLAAAGALIIGPFAGSLKMAVDRSNQISGAAAKLQTTTEAMSKLGFAAQQSGLELNDVVEVSKHLAQKAIAAKEGGLKEQKAFQALGVSAEDFVKLGVDEQFSMIADTLGALNSPMAKSALLFNLLGEESTKLIPLLNKGGDALRDMYDQAERSGSVVKTEDAQRAKQVSDAFNAAWIEVKNTIMSVGVVFLDLVNEMKDGFSLISKYLGIIRSWVHDNKELIKIIAMVGVALFALGIAATGVGIIFGVVATGIGVLTGAFSAFIGIVGIAMSVVFSPLVLVLGLIVGAVYLLSRAFSAVGKFFRDTFSGMGEFFSRTFDTIKEVISGVIKAIQKGDIESAWKIITLALRAIWNDMMATLLERWHHFTNLFVDAFYTVIDAIKVAWIKVASWVQSKLVGLVEVSVVPILEATDWVGITDNKAKKLQDRLDRVTNDLKKAKDDAMAGVDEERQKSTDLRLERQAGRRKEFTNAAEDARKEMRAIIDGLSKPDVAGEPKRGSPISDKLYRMARLGGDLSLQLGDSVKGLFQSSDFRGALAIGPASQIAQKQLDVMNGMLRELQSLNKKMDPSTFTV